jgi:hypothetical protein
MSTSNNKASPWNQGSPHKADNPYADLLNPITEHEQQIAENRPIKIDESDCFNQCRDTLKNNAYNY